MTELAEKRCIPCSGGTPALTQDQIAGFAPQVPEWKVIDNHHLQRAYRFKDFKEALDFVNRAGEIAEEQGHHPDICFGWGHAEVTIWTHAINGLTESDFILAAKIDRLQG
jgi:4a-hydroxytetrahydrobiopterin dehydratase